MKRYCQRIGMSAEPRYAHAKQMKLAQGCTRKLKPYLGHVIRDIQRKCSCPDESLASMIEVAHRIFTQKRDDENKVYSVPEPGVECVSKGKSLNRYEFGCKVRGMASTRRGCWFVYALAFHGIRMMGIPFQKLLSMWSDYPSYQSKYRLTMAIVGTTGLGIAPFMSINVDGARLLKMYGGG